jgi:hypothetical protein
MPTKLLNIIELPNTRTKALEARSTKYFTGKPCPYGHVTYRYTKSAACKDCSSPKLAAYLKKVKETQPERFKNWRTKANANWNASTKGLSAKQKWKEKDPKWAWAVSTLGSCRTRCELKNIPYEMTNVWLYDNAPDICPVLGIPLIYPTGKLKSTVNRNSATMDRLVPEKGYVPENIVVMSMAANAIKSNANSVDVQKVADWMKSCGL